MTSLGETLRRARLQRNLELNRIADELKISASMLRAIEEERFDKLPGGVFARSFVRQYARLLELDEEEIVGELRRVLEPESPPPLPANVTPPPDSGIPLPRMQGWQAVSDQRFRWSSSLLSLALVVLVMLACAGAYAWWQHDRHPVAARDNTIPAARPVQESPAPAVAPPEVTPEPAPTASTPAPAPPNPAPVETPAPSASPAANNSAPPVTVPPAAVSEANPNAAVRVEVTAEESVWISARADGQSSFTGVLEANQTRAVAANNSVWLKVGNAGGVSVSLNGKPIGPLGAKGVVRTIQLTSGGFKILPPDVPKPAPLTDSPTDSPNPL